jgi:CRISPR/Cas system-associated exonuclease Cas4 (RecB family)
MTKALIKKMVKKEPNTIDFSIIEKEIVEGHVRVYGTNKFMTKKTFAPSSLVYGNGMCPRYWYLAFEGNEFENKTDGTSFANMNAGTDAHTRIIENVLKDSEIVEWYEQYVTCDDPPINGKMDALLKIDDNLVAFELKTAKDEGFNYHKAKNSASRYHIEQVLIYMKILNLKYGAIVYENKNTFEILSIPIVVNEKHVEFINYLFDWMRRVKKAFDENQLPERGYRKDSKICKSCPLEKVCDSKDKGVIKIERRKELE